MSLRNFRRVLCGLLITVAGFYLVRCAAQIWLDGGIPASATQPLSWRALFQLGSAVAAMCAAAASYVLLHSPTNWRRVSCGIVLLLVAPLAAVMPLVGHFVQIDPCQNLGKPWPDEKDGCSSR